MREKAKVAKEIQERLHEIKYGVEYAYELTKKYNNPTISQYREIREAVSKFYDDEPYTEYIRMYPYDFVKSMYGSLESKYNHGSYKKYFKSFNKELKEKGIDIDQLIGYKIEDFSNYCNGRIEFFKKLEKILYVIARHLYQDKDLNFVNFVKSKFEKEFDKFEDVTTVEDLKKNNILKKLEKIDYNNNVDFLFDTIRNYEVEFLKNQKLEEMKSKQFATTKTKQNQMNIEKEITTNVEYETIERE